MTFAIKSGILLTILAASLSVTGCAMNNLTVPPPAYAAYSEKLPCVSRIGRCFDASIGGQPVLAIAGKARHEQISRMAHDANVQVRDVFWEVAEPVSGEMALDVQVGSNDIGRQHVGKAQVDPEVTIYMLDKQALQSETLLEEQSRVRINGQPVVTQQNILTQDHLPAGRYVFHIRYQGQHNWDRKLVIVTVK